MKRFTVTLVLALLTLPVWAQVKDYTRYVDPFIGTGGHGHTFPGATMPFGMVQLSPDTRTDNWDGSSGYHYSDDIIYGFSHTHLSGTGIPDYCDMLFMPTSGQYASYPANTLHGFRGYPSRFSHTDEQAEPGYYSVKVDDAQLKVELSSTPRVGIHRYTFPRSQNSAVDLNLDWRDKVLDSSIKVVGDTRVEGYRRSSSWSKDQMVYFVAEFSKPFTKASPAENLPDADKRNIVFHFATKEGEQILLKVALSPVSIEGARKNLAAELPGWDFDKVRADAKAAWNKELSKIDVAGGTDDQTKTFYTALYHTMIQPNIFNDVDGSYLGHDRKIHDLVAERVSSPHVSEGSTAQISTQNSKAQAAQPPRPRNAATPPLKGGEFGGQYTVFSLWDTFRAAHPLYTIIEQKRTADFINTFIRQYEQGGRLPVWELAGEETDTMIGYHAVSVIADAMAKRIKGFDYDKAYEAAKHSAELDHFGLAAYKKRGYISTEDENESVSKTLEYAYDDWCIMSMGSMLFNIRQFERPKNPKYDKAYFDKLSAEIDHYRRRAGNFENLFDTETGFFRPKQNGGFVKPFAPQEVTFHYTEGNAWQYSFFVPHDVTRLIELMGGTDKFIAKLDELFTTQTKVSGREQPDITGLMGQYAHGNEPSHHIAYLYNYAGVPSKTQKRVRQIMDEFYKPTPDGLIGNEDCGQMSAWYVLSASGFYPVHPGDERYDLGTPLFKQVTYNLENGKKFTIKAPNVSPANIYIKSAKWNGGPQYTPYITQDQIMAGGVLELDMSSTPNDKAFQSVSTSSVFRDFSAVPVIAGSGRVFNTSATVTLTSTSRNVTLHYTLDGTEPNAESPAYTAPFTMDKTTTVKAVVVRGGKVESLAAEAVFVKKPNDWAVKIASKYNRQYTGGGDEGLIDGIRGTLNFASGEWQGYQPQDFVATIDLQRETEIKSLGGEFLQNARSWIWMPTHIEFEVSADNVNFKKVADIKTDVAVTDMSPVIREYTADIAPVRARYVRVHAYNLGKIPSWHPGAGDDAFIFVDEILVK
ncbi:MAG: GH92 family glycosyl hydrolase [Acidobacteriota bacterium]